MSLKKFNAVCSWILTAVLLAHVTVSVVFMLTGLYDLQLMIILSRTIAVVCTAHILVSLAVVFILRDRADKSRYKGQKRKKYKSLNLRTLVQRASGLCILILLYPHIKLFTSFIYEFKPLAVGNKIIVFIVESLFFIMVFLHLAVSFSRSFISMGMIRTDAAEKRLDRTAFAVCAAGLAVVLVSLAVFLVKWPAA